MVKGGREVGVKYGKSKDPETSLNEELGSQSESRKFYNTKEEGGICR